MYQFPEPLIAEGSVSTNCPKEKVPTEQEYMRIFPVPVGEEVDPLEVLRLGKRLVLCTSCGNLRLID